MKFQLLFQQLQVFLVLLALFADDLVESESFPLLLADVEDDALHQVLQLPDQPLAALALLQLLVEPVQVGRTCNHSKKKNQSLIPSSTDLNLQNPRRFASNVTFTHR